MRRFFIYSKTASTSPFHRDLKKAGRWDILLHSLISALFASNKFREDVEIHLFLMGPPNSPRHISIKYCMGNSISKKDLKKLIEISLRKCKPGCRKEVHPGVFVDDFSFDKVLDEFPDSNLFMLDSLGIHIKEYSSEDLLNGVFILGDYDGFDKKIKKILKKKAKKLSLGNQIYFTSQAITIINYELDNL